MTGNRDSQQEHRVIAATHTAVFGHVAAGMIC